jgi:hypothetical protein
MLGFEGLESSHILNGDNYLLAVLVVIFMFAPFMLHQY